MLLRLPKREGIVGARLRGAGLALGDILVFLDSHCEVNYGWLEPLLARIAEDQRHVVTPDIEVINYKTFEYAKKTDPSVGVFNWEMLFKWRKITDDEKRRGNDALPLRLVTRTDMVIDAVCNIKVINENWKGIGVIHDLKAFHCLNTAIAREKVSKRLIIFFTKQVEALESKCSSLGKS